MTSTGWTTAATVPPAPWAAMCADMRVLLAVSAAGGARVTNPAGNGPPVIGEDVIGFAVTAPQSQPLVVEFTRAAGQGQAVTAAPHTTGLVVAALDRARRHWGQLLTVTTDADVTAQAVATALGEALFGDTDRAVTGVADTPPAVQAARVADAARDRALRARYTDRTLGMVDCLDAVLAELTAERAGYAVAAGMLR